MVVKGRGIRNRLQGQLDMQQCLDKCGVAVDIQAGISIMAFIWGHNMPLNAIALDVIELETMLDED